MNFEPLLAAAQPIPGHAVAAFLALVLGAVQLIRKRRDGLHRVFGWMFVVLMGSVAVTGLFIHTIQMIGPFSVIHILSVTALISLFFGVWNIRKGNVEAHRKSMKSLYFTGMILAGVFTLLPGRIMFQVLFG